MAADICFSVTLASLEGLCCSMTLASVLQHLCHTEAIGRILNFFFFVEKWLNNIPVAINTLGKSLTVISGH